MISHHALLSYLLGAIDSYTSSSLRIDPHRLPCKRAVSAPLRLKENSTDRCRQNRTSYLHRRTFEFEKKRILFVELPTTRRIL